MQRTHEVILSLSSSGVVGVVDALTEAVKYAANDGQAQMLKAYIKRYQPSPGLTCILNPSA